MTSQQGGNPHHPTRKTKKPKLLFKQTVPRQSKSSPWEAEQSSTSARRHAVQQLHHALSLHRRPLLDGGASADPAVLLLDLRGAALGDEWSQFTASLERDVLAAQQSHPLPRALLQRLFPGHLGKLQQSSVACFMFHSSTLPTPQSAARREQPRHA